MIKNEKRSQASTLVPILLVPVPIVLGPNSAIIESKSIGNENDPELSTPASRPPPASTGSPLENAYSKHASTSAFYFSQDTGRRTTHAKASTASRALKLIETFPSLSSENLFRAWGGRASLNPHAFFFALSFPNTTARPMPASCAFDS